jgi:hypothetical protein
VPPGYWSSLTKRSISLSKNERMNVELSGGRDRVTSRQWRQVRQIGFEGRFGEQIASHLHSPLQLLYIGKFSIRETKRVYLFEAFGVLGVSDRQGLLSDSAALSFEQGRAACRITVSKRLPRRRDGRGWGRSRGLLWSKEHHKKASNQAHLEETAFREAAWNLFSLCQEEASER